MSSQSTIEDRLTHVEKELQVLKAQLGDLTSNQSWIDQISGSFRDDAEFGEILKLGRQLREADRPQAG